MRILSEIFTTISASTSTSKAPEKKNLIQHKMIKNSITQINELGREDFYKVFINTETMPGKNYTLAEEIRAYNECELICINEDPLLFWNMRSTKFVILSTVAKSILCIPASQVSVERAFSDLSYIFNNRRTRL